MLSKHGGEQESYSVLAVVIEGRLLYRAPTVVSSKATKRIATRVCNSRSRSYRHRRDSESYRFTVVCVTDVVEQRDGTGRAERSDIRMDVPAETPVREGCEDETCQVPFEKDIGIYSSKR